ncbi:MAG: ATPase associated with various cellular 5 [Bacillales bacterium]|jgi:MoxR-like ATPase|nr:ATPase associated with various cellular 5 [Bacillales bacterium]
MNEKSLGIYMLGIVSNVEDVEEAFGRTKSAFINSQNSIQFLIKSISEPPENLSSEIFYTCFSSELEQCGFIDDLRELDHRREKNFIDYINNYIIAFVPYKKMRGNETVYLAKEIKLIKKNDSYLELSRYIPVPVFSYDKHKITINEFKYKLINRKYVGQIPYYSRENDDTPPFVLWADDELNYTAFGHFSSHTYAHGGFNFSVVDELKECNTACHLYDDSYFINDNIIFIKTEIFNDINSLLDSGLASPVPKDLNNNQVNHKKASPQTKLTNYNAYEINTSPTSTLLIDRKVEKTDFSDRNNSELDFLNRFIQVARDNGLNYSEKDLVNFHISMKVSNLVILQGMSGTGKSRIVQTYAKALGISKNSEKLVVIPVRPSWTDDSDLLGYVDTINSIYRSGDSKLADALVSASKEENRDKLYIILFDEMNLARIEHYFSQFLSVLEMENRNLQLYNNSLEGRLYNSVVYPPNISIHENVMFVGTVNIDESTFHFSDKVLDRSNVIRLDVLPFNQLKKLLDEAGKRKSEEIRTSETKKYTLEDFTNFRNQEWKIQLSDRELEFLWALHGLMNRVNRNLGIGPRIIRQIDLYMKNVPENLYLSRGDAFDLQIVQRIMTKIRGSEEMLKSLVGYYNCEHNMVIESDFRNLIEKYKDISDFKETVIILNQKAKELKYNGYAF